MLLRFFGDCDEMKNWICEKLLTAKEATYDNARNVHSKWQKHKVKSLKLIYNLNNILFNMLLFILKKVFKKN